MGRIRPAHDLGAGCGHRRSGVGSDPLMVVRSAPAAFPGAGLSSRLCRCAPTAGRRMIGYVGRHVAKREGLDMAEEIRAEMVANVWKVVADGG